VVVVVEVVVVVDVVVVVVLVLVVVAGGGAVVVAARDAGAGSVFGPGPSDVASVPGSIVVTAPDGSSPAARGVCASVAPVAAPESVAVGESPGPTSLAERLPRARLAEPAPKITKTTMSATAIANHCSKPSRRAMSPLPALLTNDRT
jgi:hypothetical protein